MQDKHVPIEYRLRIPPGPEPFPVQEPPDPPETPDLPVREPDPEDPGQIYSLLVNLLLYPSFSI